MTKDGLISRAVLTAIVYKAVTSLTKYADIDKADKFSIIHGAITKNLNNTDKSKKV